MSAAEPPPRPLLTRLLEDDPRIYVALALFAGWIVVSEAVGGHAVRGLAEVAFLAIVSLSIWVSGSPADDTTDAPARTVAQAVVGDAMQHVFTTLPGRLSVSLGVEMAMHHRQRTFPVLDEERLIGLVSARTLFESAILGRADACIASICSGVPRALHPADDLVTAIDRFEEADEDVLPVVEGGQLVGLVQQEDLLRPANDASEDAPPNTVPTSGRAA